MSYNEKQLQIINSAEQLFSAKGFDASSVRDIAENAGVNIAMISYYFGSKEKLMEALFQQRTGFFNLRLETLLQDEKKTTWQKLEILIDEHIERVMHNQLFHKIMICEQIINKNPVIIGVVNQLKKRNTELFGELIKEGQKTGIFKKKIDLVLIFNTILGTVTQMMVTQHYYRDFNNLNSLPDEEFHLLLKERTGNHLKTLVKALLQYEA